MIRSRNGAACSLISGSQSRSGAFHPSGADEGAGTDRKHSNFSAMPSPRTLESLSLSSPRMALRQSERDASDGGAGRRSSRCDLTNGRRSADMEQAPGAPSLLPWKGRLAGRVALVTGSSRGVGRGIALALGEAGATVYVTGRTIRGRKSRWGVPGTIQDTADEVNARGGVGIPVRCDHSKDRDTRRLLDRIRREKGRLDVLVNNAFGGEDGRKHILSYDEVPFWEHDFDEW